MRYLGVGLRSLVTVILLAVFSLFFTLSAQAASTTVNVTVCGPSTVATLSITEPQSDSVVNQPQINLRGQLEYVSQINVLIDDQYSKTLAIPAGGTSFETTVGLTIGTQTVKVEAISVCDGDSPTQAVVVTYKPDTPPSDGSETPTKTDDIPLPGSDAGGNGGGVIVGPGDPDGGSSTIDIHEWAKLDGLSWLPLSIQNLLRVADIDNTIIGVKTLGNWLRLIAVVAGLVLIIGASGIIGALARWRDGEVKRWYLWLMQLGGFGLLLGALFIT